MSRGSIIGMNSILCKESWTYEATVRSSQTASIIEIPVAMLLRLGKAEPVFLQAVRNEMVLTELNGAPQVDYLVYRNNLTSSIIEEIIQKFKLNQKWKEGERDFPEAEVVKADQHEGSEEKHGHHHG